MAYFSFSTFKVPYRLYLFRQKQYVFFSIPRQLINESLYRRTKFIFTHLGQRRHAVRVCGKELAFVAVDSSANYNIYINF